MRFVLATEKLVVGGRSYAGFPLLLDDQCRAMQPAQLFLWWLLGRGGRTDSKSTWESYGRAMYDYFAFLERNGIEWDVPQPVGLSSPIVAYRDWSKGVLKLDSSTINSRLRVVVRFYQWAKKTGLIADVPFDYIAVQSRRQPGFLAHTDASGGIVQSPDILLREKQQQVKFLTKEQIVICYSVLKNTTHRLMFELMVRTGLRQIECRTFPEKYVFDPSRRKDLTPGQKIRVHLDPRDMRIKFDKPRDIDVPYGLMQDLWDYSVRHRQKRERNEPSGNKHPVLFLTEGGRIYSEEALTQMYRALSAKVRFKVRPHMLRHSYATYLLWSLRKSQKFEGEPLLYVRDRMGHADISTTEIYLHLINSLEGHVVLAHEDEIDQLFSREGQLDAS